MKIVFIFTAFVISLNAQAKVTGLVVLDAGHTPSAPGSMGTCGTREVDANDELVSLVKIRLEQAGYKVALTRQPQAEVLSHLQSGPSSEAGREPLESLRARPARANKLKAQVFISIHHDSVKEEALISDPLACSALPAPGKGPLRISPQFKAEYQIGYNVFLSRGKDAGLNRRSIQLAKVLATAFKEAGENPSNYHNRINEPDCTSCRDEDVALGIVSRNLGVLRPALMPAVLIEVTNLLDPVMEAKSKDPEFRDKIANAILDALNKY